MDQDEPMTPAEGQAFVAHEAFAAEARRHATMLADPGRTAVERSAQAHRVLAAERRWKQAAEIWRAASEPTPQAAISERNQLASEGGWLLCAWIAVYGILLPALVVSVNVV